MFRWLRRLVLLALVGVVIHRLVGVLRPDRARNDLPPTIGGDTWPPVPVNPSQDT